MEALEGLGAALQETADALKEVDRAERRQRRAATYLVSGERSRDPSTAIENEMSLISSDLVSDLQTLGRFLEAEDLYHFLKDYPFTGSEDEEATFSGYVQLQANRVNETKAAWNERLQGPNEQLFRVLRVLGKIRFELQHGSEPD